MQVIADPRDTLHLRRQVSTRRFPGTKSEPSRAVTFLGTLDRSLLLPSLFLSVPILSHSYNVLIFIYISPFNYFGTYFSWKYTVGRGTFGQEDRHQGVNEGGRQ